MHFACVLRLLCEILDCHNCFAEIVPRRFEGSWCLPIHSQAVQESINDPQKAGKYLRKGIAQHAKTLELYDLIPQ